jgi:hypothetical protein
MKRRVIALVFAAIILMGVVSARAFTNNSERVAAAISYLETSQNADGSWGSRAAIRDTSEILKVLHDVQPTSLSITPATDWINAYTITNNDYLARKVEAVAHTGTPEQADIDTLKAAIRNGGWGAETRYERDILSTIVIARALDSAGALDTATLESVVDYLISSQNNTQGDPGFGSFSYYDNSVSSIYITSEAILFLKANQTYIDVTAVCDNAGQFLLNSMNPDGSIGTKAYESLIAAKALLKLSSMTATQRDQLYGYIYSQQDAVVGSFDANPYSTAIGLSLFGNTAPNLAIKAPYTIRPITADR